jgi:hypothetical protein
MKLTTENVRNVLEYCLVSNEELQNESVEKKHVQSVMGVFGMHGQRLEEKREEVRDLLSQLNKYPQPQPFQNLCMDKDFHQWGEHRNINELLAMGTGLNLVELDHTKKFAGIPSVVFTEAPVTAGNATFEPNKPAVVVKLPLETQQAIAHTAVLVIGDNAYLQLPAASIMATIASLTQSRRILERAIAGESFEKLLAEVTEGIEDARKEYEPYERTGVREAFEGR